MRFRVALGIVVLCGFAFYASLRSAADMLARYRAGHGPHEIADVTAYEKRFVALRASQPGHPVVEYFDDQEDPVLKVTARTLTQYALAPWIVLDRTDPPGIPGRLVVGNFHRRLPGPEQLQGLAFVRNYGRGVMLFVRSGP